jgi:hypothetical protein
MDAPCRNCARTCSSGDAKCWWCEVANPVAASAPTPMVYADFSDLMKQWHPEHRLYLSLGGTRIALFTERPR